jgi:hypothetical protein
VKTAQFIESFINIEKNENTGLYGYHPFHLVAEVGTRMDINALALTKIEFCYARAKQYVEENVDKIIMAVDFPAGLDIEHDFVAVFTIRPSDQKVMLVAIPYDPNTGELFEVIKESVLLDQIREQFNYMVFDKPLSGVN